MPTKLKQPITITFTHVENAVACALMNGDPFSLHRNLRAVVDANNPRELADQLESALTAQNIDWNTWLPEAPFKVAGHEAVFNPDGSVKVGCTTISDAEMVEILKRREKAMAPANSAAPAEWPKYYEVIGGTSIYKSRHAGDTGQKYLGGMWCESGGATMGYWEQHDGCKEITRAEAAKHLGIPEADL